VGGIHAVGAALEAASRPDGPDGLRVVEQVEQVMVARRGGSGHQRGGGAGRTPGGTRARRIDDIIQRAAASNVPVREVGPEDCDRLSGVRSQGVAATIRYRYAELSAVLSESSGVLVFLDGVEDPHNLGAVIRSAAAVGAGAVIVPRHRAAGVTAGVMRASAGMAVLVPVCCVTNLVPAIREARDTGCWVTGLDAAGAGLLRPADPGRRQALVIGGEGRGLRPLVARNCDEIARLPMAAGVESLNASAAAAIALYRLCERVLFPAPER